MKMKMKLSILVNKRLQFYLVVRIYFIFLLPISNQVNRLEKQLVVPINVTFLTITSMRYLSAVPAIEIAIQEINNSTHGQFRVDHVLIYRKHIFSCDVMADYIVDLASEYHYGEKSRNALHAIVGPNCFGDLFAMGPLIKEWNIPFISILGPDPVLNNKIRYPTLLTASPIHNEVTTSFFNLLMTRYNWTTICLLCDDNNDYAFFRVNCRNLRALFKPPRFQLNVLTYNSAAGTVNYDLLLGNAKASARVMIILSLAPITRNFMVRAHMKNMTGKDYIYFSLHPYTSSDFRDHAWNETDENDGVAFEAYASLLIIKFDNGRNVDALPFNTAAMIKRRSQNTYNLSYAPNEKVSALTVSAYEAALLVGKVVEESLSEGDYNLSDGSKFCRRFWNKTFTLPTGQMYINAFGDRYPDILVKQLNQTSKEIESVLIYIAANGQLQNMTENGLMWIGGQPPNNEPRCGFRGDKPECSPIGQNFSQYYATIALIVALLVVLIVIGSVLIQRHANQKATMLDSWWKIDSWDITLIRETKSCSSSTNTLKYIRKEMSDLPRFKGQTVWLLHLDLKRPPIMTKPLRSFLTKIKAIRNVNIDIILGIVVDAYSVTLVSLFYVKRSLQDVYQRTSADWELQASLLNDVLQGLGFIHSSFLFIHGRLRSSKCLIDNRFGIRIGDSGREYIREQLSGGKANETEQDEKLLWTSPEIIHRCGASRTQKGDIFALGIILYEVIAWMQPYVQQQELCVDARRIIARIVNLETPPFRPVFPEEVVNSRTYALTMAVIRSCWEEDPAKRPTITEVIKSFQQQRIMDGKQFLDKLLKRLERYSEEMEEIVHTRTWELIEEGRKSDALLRELLPKQIAQRLRNGQTIEAEIFSSVTIYFSDVCGFVTFVATTTPLAVIQLLSQIYDNFDKLLPNFDVYKVETVADSYVISSKLPELSGKRKASRSRPFAVQWTKSVQNCDLLAIFSETSLWSPGRHKKLCTLFECQVRVTSGLPVPNESRHASEIALMAIAFLRVFTAAFNRLSLQLRIGIHSGSCAAGVVGKRTPRYCLFGDAVNMASRMESTGEPSLIHISLATFSILKSDTRFALEPRGFIWIKGKGQVETYWLSAVA